MSTLGKVLTFLNVIAAVLLLYLAGADYGKAREARHSLMLHELAKGGLPVDANELDPEHPEEPIAAKLSTDLLTDVFKGADGGQDLGGARVKTVLEELDRVKLKVSGNINGAPTPEQKKTKLRGYLLMQARDVKERDQFKQIIDKVDVAAGIAELDKRFADVRAKYSGSDKNDVRYAAARLFVDLSSEPAWLERVRVVCGLDPLAAALDQSAHVMTLLGTAVKENNILDQGHFLAAYNSLVNQLLYESENLYEANKKLAELRALVERRQTEVAQRKTEVERNKTELAALVGATNGEVARLEAIQRDLFAIQQRLGQALDETYKLEEQLKQRFGKGK